MTSLPVRFLVGLLSVILISACSHPQRSVTSGGPIDLGLPAGSPWAAESNSEFGWGLVVLRSPDEREFTVLDARALTDDADASLQPAFAVGSRRIGAKQIILTWPPPKTVAGGHPEPLPITIPPLSSAEGELGVEVLVGIRVPSGGTVVRGVEVTYTDGSTTWRDVVPHFLNVCADQPLSDCPSPSLDQN